MAKRSSTASSEDDEDFIDRTFESNEKYATQKYTFYPRVKERLDEMGMSSMDKPVLDETHEGIFTGLKPGQYYDGRLPTVIRSLSLDQMRALLSIVTNWYTYILQQASLVSAELSEAKRQREFMWSMIRTRMKDQARRAGVKVPDVRITDLAMLDQRFIDVDARLAEIDTLDNCVQAMLRSAGHNLKTVSRDITVIQIKIESEARGRGLGGNVPSRFAQQHVYTPRTPVDSDDALTGLEDEDGQHESEVERDEEAPEPRQSATPAKAKGGVRPRLQLNRKK